MDPVKKSLDIVGSKNRYQYMMILVFSLLFYAQVFPILGISFYYMDPVFVCKGDDQPVDEKYACPKLDQCQIKNNFTIVSQLGLYCDDQGPRDVIQAMLSVGSLLGLLFMNFVSDIKGRKTALLIATGISIVGVLCTIIGAYTKTITLLIMGSLFSGYGGYSTFTICYIIAGEFCEDKLRQRAALIMNFAYSVGLVSFFFFYNWMNQWYNILVLIILIPLCGLFFIIWLLILESPFYYDSIGCRQQCIDTLITIAAYNKKENVRSIDSILDIENSKQEIVQASQTIKLFFKTLRNKQYLMIIILTALTQAGGNIFYFGIEFAIDDIGFDYGVDNVMLGTTEMVATVVLAKFVTDLPRRKTIMISYSIVVGSTLLFLIPFFKDSAIVASIVIIAIRALTTLAYFMIIMVQTQSFPAQIQSVGAGSIEAFSQLGSIIAPLIITVSVNLGLNKMVTMGAITFLLTFCIKCIPEPSRSQKQSKQIQNSLIQSVLE